MTAKKEITPPSNKRLTNRQLNALKTKQRIFHSALHLIQKKGYDNVSIQEITEDAQVAKGSFYTHFPSKEYILRYTYEDSDQIYESSYNSLPNSDFKTALSTFVFKSYEQLELRGKEILKAIISHLFSDNLSDLYNDHSRNLYFYLAKIIDKGKENGELNSDTATEEYVKQIIIALFGVEFYWSLSNDNSSLAREVTALIQTLADGMIISKD